MEDNRKVFLVTVEFDYITIAENEYEAKKFASQAMSDTCCIEDYCSVGPLTHVPADWEDNCLVYHHGDEDITVRQACEMSPEYQKQKAYLQKRMQSIKNNPPAPKNSPPDLLVFKEGQDDQPIRD